MLSPPKQIPVKLLLFNATSDHFFDSQMKKKNLSKQLQNFIQRRNAKNKEQFIKNKRLSDYIYSIANKLISFFFTGNTV